MRDSAPNQDPPEIFVETSVHVCRFKSPLAKKKIDDRLAQSAVVGSSTYVKLEYGNVVLKIVSYLLNQLRKRGSLEALRYHVANELNPRYHAAYITWGFNVLSTFGREEAAERAEHALEAILLLGTKAVDSKVDAILDGINCVWADGDASRGWRSPTKCELRRPGCRIDAFFKDNEGFFLEIKDEISATGDEELTNQLRGFASLIPAAQRNPSILRTYQNCRQLADAIIAVQSKQGPRGYSSFFTQNKAESLVLCKALKQLLLYLPQGLEQEIERHDFRAQPASL